MLGHIGLPEKPEARWEWMMARISQRQMNTLFQIAYEILKNKDDTDDVISESLVIAAEKLHKLKDPDKLFSWINDQLHLGITFPEPLNIDPDKAEITESTKFSTLEETVQHVNLPVIYLKDSGDLKLSSISADVILDEKPVLSIIYCNSNDNITILIYAHDSTNAISSSFATNYRIVSSNVGDVFVCESEDGANAYLFYDDYSIRINTSLDLSTFCTVLQSLALFKLS